MGRLVKGKKSDAESEKEILCGSQVGRSFICWRYLIA
jgi:hypothetical protein